jgi:hypothetical protein
MDVRREDGVALMIAMMAMLLLTALGVVLVLTTSSETIIANNFRNSGEALHAADAAMERAIDDLLTEPDWNALLNGSRRSGFIDGAPGGTRRLGDGSSIDLEQTINMANCEKATTCSIADMNRPTSERPWGANNPRWHLYAYGNLSELMPTESVNSGYYVVVMVADDPSELDDDPTSDGTAPCQGAPVTWDDASAPPTPSCNPGSGVIALRADAYGPRGAHKAIEATVSRTDTTELERGYTGQGGQDEQNQRARRAAVQIPGRALSSQSMTLGTGGVQ